MSIHFKEISLPDYTNLLEDLQYLLDEGLDWGNHGQICLNSVPGKTNDPQYGVGSTYYDYDTKDNAPRPVELRDEDFTELCDVFVGTEFEDLYRDLSSKYKLGRVRIIKMTPRTCMTWHTDITPRLHYPIKTNDKCFMVIEKEVEHLKEGQWYWTNTILPHTAFNGSREDRIHIVVVFFD